MLEECYYILLNSIEYTYNEILPYNINIIFINP